MKSKILSSVLIIGLVIPLLSFPSFAADLTNEDVVDAQGGFFRDIGNLFTDGFGSVVSSIKRGISHVADGIGKVINTIISVTRDAVNAIGGFFSRLANVITYAVDYLCDFLVSLLLPSRDYFPRVHEQLQTALNKKLGGVLSVTEYFKTRFAGLRANPDVGEMLTAKFPNGHIFGDWRINFIARILPAAPLFRDVFSALMVIATVLFCYRHVKEMINT